MTSAPVTDGHLKNHWNYFFMKLCWVTMYCFTVLNFSFKNNTVGILHIKVVKGSMQKYKHSPNTFEFLHNDICIIHFDIICLYLEIRNFISFTFEKCDIFCILGEMLSCSEFHDEPISSLFRTMFILHLLNKRGH